MEGHNFLSLVDGDYWREESWLSKALEMAKVSARGGFNLFWGLAISSVISALGVIIVARLLSPSEYGIVAVAIIVPNFLTLFRDWGVNSAVIKFTAEHKALNKKADIKTVVTAGLTFELLLGILLSVISFLASDFLAIYVFHRPDIAPLIQIASFNIFGTAMLTAAQSAFTGYEKMELHSITMMSRTIIKTVFSPILVLLGLGALGAVVGGTIAYIAAGILGLLILYRTIYKSLVTKDFSPLSKDKEPGIRETMKNMLKYGLPLSISTILRGALTQFYSFLMAIYVVDLLIGNYQVALNFSVLITFFSLPMATVLFPAFSKLDLNEGETLRNVFRFSVKYASLVVVPAAALVISLSEPAISTLFGSQYGYAPLYLALISVSYLYPALGNLSVGNLINSQGKTTTTLKLTLLTSAIGFPMSLLLIPRTGIIGLIVTTLVAGIPSLIMGLLWVNKSFHVTVDWISSVRILAASALSATITYVVISQLHITSWIELVIGTATFAITYFISAPLIGAVTKVDIQNLKETSKGLGPLYQLLRLPLHIIEKLTLLKNQREETDARS